MKASRIPLTVAALAAMTGCSLITPGQPGSQEETEKPAASSSAEATSTEARATQGASVEGEVPQNLGQPIGTREVQHNDDVVQLDLYPVQRGQRGAVTNGLLTVKKTSGSLSSTIMAADTATTPDSFKIIDVKGGKAYLPARGNENKAVCGPDFSPLVVKPGTKIYVTCVFGSLPEDVSSVTVSVNPFGSFANVPVR